MLDEPAEHLAVEPSDRPGGVNGDPGHRRSLLWSVLAFSVLTWSAGVFLLILAGARGPPCAPQESRTISSTSSMFCR
jgi:hypothetical protein